MKLFSCLATALLCLSLPELAEGQTKSSLPPGYGPPTTKVEPEKIPSPAKKLILQLPVQEGLVYYKKRLEETERLLQWAEDAQKVADDRKKEKAKAEAAQGKATQLPPNVYTYYGKYTPDPRQDPMLVGLTTQKERLQQLVTGCQQHLLYHPQSTLMIDLFPIWCQKPAEGTATRYISLHGITIYFGYAAD